MRCSAGSRPRGGDHRMLLQMIMHGFDIALHLVRVGGLAGACPARRWPRSSARWRARRRGCSCWCGSSAACRKMLALIVPADLLDTVALRRKFALSRDLMIRSVALMTAYGYFAAQGSRMGEVALSANAILLNFLMIGGFFLDFGIAQGGRAALRQGGGRQLAAGLRSRLCAVVAVGLCDLGRADGANAGRRTGADRRHDHQRGGARTGADVPVVRGCLDGPPACRRFSTTAFSPG